MLCLLYRKECCVPLNVNNSNHSRIPVSGYNRDANHPGALKMSPIRPVLHHLLNLLKRLWIIGDKVRKLGIRQISTHFQRCLSLIIGRFMSKSCKNRPSMPYDKADHHWHGMFYNVDCFRKLPSFFGRSQSSQSLPLHHEEQHYYPDLQTRPSTSQALVPYSTTPVARDDTNVSLRSSTLSSTTTKAEDDCSLDPPGLSKEISDFVGVTSAEFQRYERNFTWYVLTTDYHL